MKITSKRAISGSIESYLLCNKETLIPAKFCIAIRENFIRFLLCCNLANSYFLAFIYYLLTFINYKKGSSYET